MFLRGLRLLLALDFRDIVVGQAVVSAIREKFIPELKASLEQRDSERTRDLIELWESYADEPNVWNAIAANQIRLNTIKHRVLTDEHSWDIGQDIAVELFASGLSAFDFNPHDGPERFKGWWKQFVAYRVMNHVRKLVPRLLKEQGRQNIRDDEGEGVDALTGIPAPMEETDIDRAEIRSFKKALRKHLETKTDEVGIALYDHWVAAVEKHPDRVNVKKEVYEPVMDISGKGRTTLEYHWKKVKGFIVKYLEDHEGMRLTENLKSDLNIASVDRIALDRWAVCVAEWLLEPRKYLESLCAAV